MVGCMLMGGCGCLCALLGSVGVPSGAARRARAVAAHPAAAAERAEAGCESFVWHTRFCRSSHLCRAQPVLRGNTRVQRAGLCGRKGLCGKSPCPYTELPRKQVLSGAKKGLPVQYKRNVGAGRTVPIPMLLGGVMAAMAYGWWNYSAYVFADR